MGIFFTGDSTVEVTATADGQFWINEAGDVVSSAGSYGFSFSSFDHATLIVEGTITATSTAVTDAANGSGRYNSVLVQADGLVSGAKGIVLYSNSNYIVNHGTIEGTNTDGIVQTAAGASIVNFGTVTGVENGVTFGDNVNTLTNSGSISGGVSALKFVGFTSSSFVDNDGMMVADVGIAYEGGLHVLHNGGVIEGTGGTAIASVWAVVNVVNDGLIDGHINLGNADDAYLGRNGGSTTGFVKGEAGDDTLTGSSAADSLNGGDGVDFILGRGGDDRLIDDEGGGTIFGGSGVDYIRITQDNTTAYGGSGGDDMRGGSGENNLVGGTGKDEIRGGSGNDDLFGSGGTDSLFGGADVDILFGGGGNDTLTGGAGNDQLVGGKGSDLLYGGADMDLFTFQSGSTGTDRIKDWQDGADIINIVGIGPLPGSIGDFVNDNVRSSNGNAVIDLTDYNAGKIIVEGAAGEINADDFIYI